MVERRERPFNIFQQVTIRKTRCKNILEKSVLEKLGFFLPLVLMKLWAGRILLTICILFTPGCQTLRNERHYISLNFLFENHASVSFTPIKNNSNLTLVITIIQQSSHSKSIGSLSSDARQPEVSLFLFNMPWHHQICIAKCFYS